MMTSMIVGEWCCLICERGQGLKESNLLLSSALEPPFPKTLHVSKNLNINVNVNDNVRVWGEQTRESLTNVPVTVFG